MISFLRGPGGLGSRLAAEFVPFVVGGVTAAFPLTMVSPWLAPLTWLLVWCATSVVLRWVRRRPRLRLLYRVALVGHVLFWSALGIAAWHAESAGPGERAGSTAWPAATMFRAGYGQAEYRLPAHTTLAGWGSRPRRLTAPAFGGFGVLGRLSQTWMAAPGETGSPRWPMFCEPDDDAPNGHLGARAIVLVPEGEGAPVVFVRMDLVTSDADLVHAIQAAVADLGYRPEGVLVSATHTHSGPGGYSRSRLSALLGTDHFDPACQSALRTAAVRAIREAHAAAVPARLALVRSRDRDPAGVPILARRRRGGDATKIDDRVFGLRFYERASERPIAVLLNYPVHPVILRRRHMAFDRDLAGALEDTLSAHLRGAPPVLFVNGAQGDVSPQHGAVGGAAHAASLAARFAERIAPDFEAAGAAGAAARVSLAAMRVRRRQASPAVYVGVGARDKLLAALDHDAGQGGLACLGADLLALPANALIWSIGLTEMRVGFSWRGAVGARLGLGDGVGEQTLHFGALALELVRPGRDAERLALLWEPGEATCDLGKSWREMATALGFADTLVLGLTNGSCAYLTTAAEYRQEGYEAVGTVFGAGAGPAATEALEQALTEAQTLLKQRR